MIGENEASGTSGITTDQTYQDILAAKDLVANEDRWCKNEWCRIEAEDEVPSFCVEGAFGAAVGLEEELLECVSSEGFVRLLDQGHVYDRFVTAMTYYELALEELFPELIESWDRSARNQAAGYPVDDERRQQLIDLVNGNLVYRYLPKLGIGSRSMTFNDRGSTEHADVIAVFDLALLHRQRALEAPRPVARSSRLADYPVLYAPQKD